MPRKPARRRWREGGISWLSTTKVRLRVRTPRGVRSKTVTVAHRDHGGRGEADQALADFVTELATPPSRVQAWTLGAAFDAYVLDAKRQGRRGGTLTSYRQVKARLGDLENTLIADMTPEDLDLLYGDLAEKYADSTIVTTHHVIAAVLERCVEWERLERNVAKAARPPTVQRKDRTDVTPADIWVLIGKAIDAKDLVLAMAIFLAAVTGARRAELSGLQWPDVDAKGGGIHFARQWAVNEAGRKVVQDLKSATGTDGSGRRYVWVGQSAIDVLERYRERLRGELGVEPEGWLLSYDGGVTPVKPNSLGAQIIAHCRKHGYDVTTHDFRRFTASELIAGGADVTVAADRMGHTPQMMLGRYARARKDRAIAAGQALEARLIDQGLPIAELLAKTPNALDLGGPGADASEN